MRKFRRQLRHVSQLRSNRAADRARSYGLGLVAAIAAAGAAFFFDPRSGGRRRALMRDHLHRSVNQSREFLGKAGRDARQRIGGSYSGLLSRFRRAEELDDRIVEERVRAALGRLTTHPGAVDGVCRNGVVYLSGHILQDDADRVVRGLARVRGVREVVNELRVHEDARSISALQGGSTRQASPRFEFRQTNWSPAPRALAGAGGLAISIAGAMAGVSRRNPLGYGLALGGGALLARSICNRPLLQIVRRATRTSSSARSQVA